jgi:hypothetical protein
VKSLLSTKNADKKGGAAVEEVKQVQGEEVPA